jgi:uncharacterized membrane protein
LRNRPGNDLILVVALTLLLIPVVILVPSNIPRIILGLPFILFFPGYSLVSVLFPSRSSLSTVERVAYSLALSISIVALTGLLLNYIWSITLYPMLGSISFFILVCSAFAWHRRGKLPEEEKIYLRIRFNFNWTRMPAVDKVLGACLVVALLGAAGTSVYTYQKNQQGFTEFYILGIDGKAADYPSEFYVISDPFTIINVSYGGFRISGLENYGEVTLGIANQERELVAYTVEIRISGEPVNILHNGRSLPRLEGLVLEHGQKWEQPVGFAPTHIGDDQKVEFLLYREGQPEIYQSLHLWVDVLVK